MATGATSRHLESGPSGATRDSRELQLTSDNLCDVKCGVTSNQVDKQTGTARHRNLHGSGAGAPQSVLVGPETGRKRAGERPAWLPRVRSGRRRRAPPAGRPARKCRQYGINESWLILRPAGAACPAGLSPPSGRRRRWRRWRRLFLLLFLPAGDLLPAWSRPPRCHSHFGAAQMARI